MPILPFTPTDPALAPYREMHGHAGVAQTASGIPCFICEGRFLVGRALSSNLRLLSLVVTESVYADLKAQLAPEVPVYVGTKQDLESLVGYAFHRGVLACVACPEPATLPVLLAAKRLVVLPHLDGVENLGLILRSAAALGMDAVLVGKGPEVFHRRTVRVSMGAAWTIPTFCADEVLPVLDLWRAHESGAQVAAAALVSGAVDARRWQPAPRTALMMGPEGYGLDDRHLAACDTKVVIPMRAGMDSLNVAACAAILMYQMGA